jgi:hypothetical protein
MSRGNARRAGTSAMELLNMFLDLADAVSAGVALAAFWYGWVAPPPAPRALPPPRCAGEPDEVEQFVRAAALIRPSRGGIT